MKQIRIGSRDSALAVVQSNLVVAAINVYDPLLEVELVTMKTTGDKILDQTLDKIGGKGLFVKELDAALSEGRVDLTVHSCKDMPMDLDTSHMLAAISRREDPRDVLILPQGGQTLDPGKPIGCSSARRALQLKALYPEMEVIPIRGNVQTRLGKLDDGQFSALVLAAAGIIRLGLQGRIHRTFTVEEMLPAAGQGILAVQCRAGAQTPYLEGFHDEAASWCLLAERAFVKTLDGGCSSPVAAYATLNNDQLHLTGMDITPEGKPVYQSIDGPKKQAKELGQTLARQIRGAHGSR